MLDPEAVPHLPLVDDWQSGRFALRDVMRFAPDTSIREWSMRLMQRYRYVIGAPPLLCGLPWHPGPRGRTSACAGS